MGRSSPIEQGCLSALPRVGSIPHMFLGLASIVLSVWSCQKRLRASHSTRSRIGHDGNSKKDEVGHWQRCEAYKTFASGEMGSRVPMRTIKSVVAVRGLLGWMAGRCLTTTFSFAIRTAPRASVTEMIIGRNSGVRPTARATPKQRIRRRPYEGQHAQRE